jgi:hypothetical protein
MSVNKTSINEINGNSPTFNEKNRNNQPSLKNVLTPPKSLALTHNNNNNNINNKNDYELKNFHENETKQTKTPTSTNSFKKMFVLNGHNSKKFKHRTPLEINGNNKDYESLDEDIDNENDENDAFGDDILSQSLTSSNVTNFQLNKKSLSKPSLRNIIVPLPSPSIPNSTTRPRTTSGSSNKGASDLIQT